MLHDVVLIVIAVVATLVALGIFSAVSAWYNQVAPAALQHHIERTITIDDFEPNEMQQDQIRRAVLDFDRQRTPLELKNDPQSNSGKSYDYYGPRMEAGRLFGVVLHGEIVMFYQWRDSPSERRPPQRNEKGVLVLPPTEPRWAILQQFWKTVPGAEDADGWPVKPDKVFEINPGIYGPEKKDQVVVRVKGTDEIVVDEREGELHLDASRMHPALKRELGIK